ncbi:chromate transporter [Lentisphaerota bacterium ZTH]|nr:chromate transporter [Lentisphaerota bacterium]WET07136.1 chromate transporter [Lentisphaerota bacterium ZTH]
MTVLVLFFRFMVIGTFCYGGGYAILPLLQEAAMKYHWLTKSEFVDMIALAQMTPGPIAVNMATYAGFKTAGVPGAIAATTGILLPGAVITFILIVCFMRFRETRFMKSILYGLRPTVTGLIAFAALKIALVSLFPEGAAGLPLLEMFKSIEFKAVLIFAVSLLLIYKKVGTVPLLICAVIAGILIM